MTFITLRVLYSNLFSLKSITQWLKNTENVLFSTLFSVFRVDHGVNEEITFI
jgi:hypothetical protein